MPKFKMKKPKRMCSWCGKKEAKISGARRNPTWCSKKCQDEELDNKIFEDCGIDLKETRAKLKEFVNKIKAARQ
jgi:hypothetical protein